MGGKMNGNQQKIFRWVVSGHCYDTFELLGTLVTC